MLIIILLSSISIHARTGLEIDKLFTEQYAADPQVTETILSGNNRYLKKHNLSVFSTFKAPAAKYQAAVEQMVLSDARKAIGKNVRYKDGKLYYALFILSPVTSNGNKTNRYIYYLNNSSSKGGNVMVIYLEGKLSDQEVSSLLQSAK